MIAWRHFIVCGMAVGLLVPGAAGCRREKPKTIYEIQDDTRRRLDEQQQGWQEEREAVRSEGEAPLTPAQQAERAEQKAFDEAQVQGNVSEARDQWLKEGPMDNPGPDEEGSDEDESEEAEPAGEESGAE